MKWRGPLGVLLLASCGQVPTGPAPEPEGGAWRTWVLASGGSVVVPSPSPPGSAAERAELAEVRSRQASVDAATRAAIPRWDEAPSLAWTDELLGRFTFWWALLPDVRVATPVRSARVAALMHVAIHDALVATWHAKYQHRRTPPFQRDAGIRRMVATDGSPSYPSEHAAAAAAAAAILAYGFPGEDSLRFLRLAEEAGASRVAAGVAYPSDVIAGAALGRAVAERVLARAREDGADTPWTGVLPAGDDQWRPTPPKRVAVPYDPGAGAWTPWVLASADLFRPPPPPAMVSPRFLLDLEELRRLGATRSTQQADIARYWATDPPESRWLVFAQGELRTRHANPLRAARVMSALTVAMYDAFLACWDAKFHYGLLRPVSADTSLVTVFSTPPFPSYPSGHSTGSAAAAEVLGWFFPERAAHFHARASEASLSRVWGGVHYRFDVEAGDVLGAAVGKRMVERLASEKID